MTSPLAPPPPTGQPIDRWLYLLWKRIEAAAAAASGAWTSLDFTGSDINDILTRNHEDLQNLNTTTYTHMTSAEHTGTGSGVFVRKTGPTMAEAVVEASGSTAALRITNTGTGNALVVEDETNPDSTPVVVDASGRAVVGHTAALNLTASVIPTFQVVGASSASQWAAFRYGNDAAGTGVNFFKSRSATLGGSSIVSSGDSLGTVGFYGDDGGGSATAKAAAAILCEVDGTPGSSDMPGRLLFMTTADGASTVTERVRVSANAVKMSANLVVADGYVIIKDQPTPAQKSSTGTLTAANILTGIINADGASSYTLTLDTGTNFEAGITSWPTDGAVDWAVVYTGGAEDFLTIAGDTGHTIVGATTIVEGGSAMFRTRKTATNTFVTYRLT